MSTAGHSNQFEARPEAKAALMELALKKTGAGFLFQSETLSVLFSGNLPLRSKPATSTAIDIALFGAEEGARLIALKSVSLRDNTAASAEIAVASPSGTITYRIDIEPLTEMGRAGILSVITDISDTLHRERILKTLLRELSHRSKNLLAIIQGIATQTARQAVSLDGFLTKFRGRIQSLSYSQDLVTDSSWRGAYLFALAERQFHAYWPNPDNPIALTGINAHLSPNAALHIGLALHELIVNSASHGAIAVGVNALTLDCSETLLEGMPAIELLWIEHLPFKEPKPETDEYTFARTVLERVVPIAIGGKAHYLTANDRIEYHLTIPSREYEIITRLDA